MGAKRPPEKVNSIIILCDQEPDNPIQEDQALRPYPINGFCFISAIPPTIILFLDIDELSSNSPEINPWNTSSNLYPIKLYKKSFFIIIM